jgi:hypothetical protein
MIRVRLSSHWRIRRSEWLLSLCILSLGIVYLNVPGLFEPQYFAMMMAFMPQRDWGILATCVGLFRLTLLLINGAWRASPHGRALGAQVSCFMWAMLFVSAVGAEKTVQSVGFWLIFFIFDAFSAVDAAGDARMADEKARAARIRAGTADASESA